VQRHVLATQRPKQGGDGTYQHERLVPDRTALSTGG
jgi:hypothetical protein